MAKQLSASVARAVAKAVAKSLAISAIIVCFSAIAWQANPVAGSLVLLTGSFTQVALAYRKEWRLQWVTCLLPPFATGLAYIVQLSLLRTLPRPQFFLPVAALGVVVGWLRGRAHRVFVRDGRVFATRTVWYLISWLVSFGVSQVFALARANNLVAFGLLGGAFSTSMLASVSIVLTAKHWRQLLHTGSRGGANIAAAIVGLIAAGALIAGPSTQAHAPMDLLDRLMPTSEIPVGFRPQTPNASRDELTEAHRTYLRSQSEREFTQINLKVKQYASSAQAMAAGNYLATIFSKDEPGMKRSVERLGMGDFSYVSVQQTEMETLGSGNRSRFLAQIAIAEVYKGEWSYSVAIYSRLQLDAGGARQLAVDLVTKMDRAFTSSSSTGGIAGIAGAVTSAVSGGGASPEGAEAVAIVSAIIAILTALGASAANGFAAAVASAAQAAAKAAGLSSSAPPLEEDDGKGLIGQEAIDELIHQHAPTVKDRDGKVWVLEPPEFGDLPSGIQGIAFTNPKQIPDPTDPTRTISVLDPGHTTIIKEWKHPPLWRGETRTTVETWVEPGGDLAGTLAKIGFKPKTVKGTDGNTYVLPPENSPDNVAGVAWTSTKIVGADGKTVEVLDPKNPAMIEHWPTTTLGMPPPETVPHPDPPLPASRVPPPEDPPQPSPPEAGVAQEPPSGDGDGKHPIKAGGEAAVNPRQEQPKKPLAVDSPVKEKPTAPPSGDSGGSGSSWTAQDALRAIALITALGVAGALAVAASESPGVLAAVEALAALGVGGAGSAAIGGAPALQPPPTPPTLPEPQLFPQEESHSCAVASARMGIHRLTGLDIPEATLRQMSMTTPGGYVPGVGTTSQGMVNLLNQVPGVSARIESAVSIGDIKRELAAGNQVMISYNTPPQPGTPPSGHTVLVRDVWSQFDRWAGGDEQGVLKVDDPVLGVIQHSASWWEQNGWHGEAVVVSRVP